jgi:uncharacterized phage-like protein YoqJ
MILMGTGHRPKYLPGGWSKCEKTEWFSRVMTRLDEYLDRTKRTGELEHVISGLCSGWDIWLAEKCFDRGIDIHAYVPFPGQGSNWSKDWQRRRNEMENYASQVYITANEYSNAAFHKRDRAMVDNSDIVLSLLHPDATKSGTAATVRYAEKLGKEILPFWEDEE